MESWSLSNPKRDVSACECSGNNIKLSQCQRDISWHLQAYGLKAGFHMIVDRRLQIAIRSTIVCDHMETTSAIVSDPAIAIADDRRK